MSADHPSVTILEIGRAIYPSGVLHYPSTVACLSWRGELEERWLIPHKDPPGGLIYSRRHAWGLSGELSMIDHPFSPVAFPLTWV